MLGGPGHASSEELAVFEADPIDPPVVAAVRVLLRVRLSGLPALCLKFCRRVELLLDACLRFQGLLRLLGLRGTAGGGRDCSLSDAAGGKR